MVDKSTGMWAESAPVSAKAVNTQSILDICGRLSYAILRNPTDNNNVPQRVTVIKFRHEETEEGHVFSAFGHGVPR